MKSSHIFGRHSKINLPLAISGNGPWITDADNKTYLDACGGAAVSCLGYHPSAVIEAVKNQLDSLAYVHSGFFTTTVAEQLADKLCKLAPEGIERAYILNGGSEATEAAIKLAKQYFQEQNKPTKSQFIARHQSYHGNTLGALSAGGNAWRRKQFEQILSPAMHHIEPCHYWRFAQDSESEYDYGQRVATSLEDKILQLGAENVAAFIAEPVVGATMGVVPAVNGYFKKIREICDTYDVLLILDEVMCGIGRTGTFFASEQEDITPDIVCVAKGLGAGIQPLGAMLCSERIYNTIAKGSGFFQHGHTYMAHASACAAGLAVLQTIENNDLLNNIQQMGKLLGNSLHKALADHPNVGNIRGRGLFWGIELVANKVTKEPLSPELKTAAKIKKAAMQTGLMCYPMSGTIDGARGDHILLAPAYIVDQSHIKEIVARLTKALHIVLGR